MVYFTIIPDDRDSCAACPTLLYCSPLALVFTLSPLTSSHVQKYGNLPFVWGGHECEYGNNEQHRKEGKCLNYNNKKF